MLSPLQALPGWPHVMSTGRRQTLTGRSDGGASGGSGGGPGGASSSGSNSGSGRLGAAMRAARRRAAGAQVLLLAGVRVAKVLQHTVRDTASVELATVGQVSAYEQRHMIVELTGT